MNDQRPERRRFQFGLRKLLLSRAVVVAVFVGVPTMVSLGILAMLEIDLTGFAIWTSCLVCFWLGVVAILQNLLGPKVAGVLSAGTGAILGGLFEYSLSGGRFGLGMVFGLVFGCIAFVILQGMLCAANWADNLMETKSDGGTRRD
jgi:hypothetical protein